MSEYVADYELRQKLREGSHGALFLAVPPDRLGGDHELVAVKALHANATDEDFRRVANELRLLHSVASEFVIELLDAGNDRGRLFIVMKYYAEGSLDEAFGRLDPMVVRQAIADAARGVHALHEIGVAHRDIKPANILLEQGRGRIAELALAQMAGGQQTTGVGPLGALEFMAPESVRGAGESRRTDVWSLGMTLHRTITGESAVGEIPRQSLIQACRHVLQTVPAITDGVDDSTRQILYRCFAEDPADRYSTALEFADDLEQTLRGARHGA